MYTHPFNTYEIGSTCGICRRGRINRLIEIMNRPEIRADDWKSQWQPRVIKPPSKVNSLETPNPPAKINPTIKANPPAIVKSAEAAPENKNVTPTGLAESISLWSSGGGINLGIGNIGEVMGSWVKDWKGSGNDPIVLATFKEPEPNRTVGGKKWDKGTVDQLTWN